MALTTKVLLVGIALLMIDAIIELAFISDMVSWLHVRAGTAFRLRGGPNGSFSLKGKLEYLLVDQGHTSNSAAGAAFVVVGMGGFLVLWLRDRQMRNNGKVHSAVRGLYTFWLYFTIVSAVFSVVALSYVQVVTARYAGQHIDLALAWEDVHDSLRASTTSYQYGRWTPQNWFSAILEYEFVDVSARQGVQLHLAIMQGWRWNIVPMAMLGVVVAVLAWMNRSRDLRDRLDWYRREKDVEIASQ